ncbi:MAG: ABC transporter permease [Acetobacteraceae bacterium]|nr:ABC transporter permease [Acetobacteraceae bacterium]
MPIDPVLAIVGDRAPQDVVERARIELGLDRPLYIQFFRYLTDILQGNFGRSVMTGNTVLHDIGRFFPATLELATLALVIALALGIPIGVISAVRQNTWLDRAVRIFCLAGHSLPTFVLALLGLLFFYARLGWFPPSGRQGLMFDGDVPTVTSMMTIDALITGNWPAFLDAAHHLALPALVLGYYSLAYIARMTRAFMLEQLRAEYVTTARVKGISETRVIWRHAFGNISVQLITVVALTYAGLLEGAVLTETIFSWPGLGQYLTVSLLNADMNAVLGATLVVGLMYLVLNLLADAMYRLLDPRVR